MKNSIVLTPALVVEIGISALQLSVGELGRDIATNDIVLRVDEGVVNLHTSHLIQENSFTIPRVKKLNAGDKITITVGISKELIEEVKQELRYNKINAIKPVRSRLGWNLRESKDFVESLETQPTATPSQVSHF